jgi:hypothetical protein
LLRKEVGFLARAVANFDVQMSSVDKHFLDAYPLSDPLLYKALAPKIGLLSPDLIIGITEFHANFREAKISLSLLVDNPERKYG